MDKALSSDTAQTPTSGASLTLPGATPNGNGHPDSVTRERYDDPSIQARFAAYDSPFFKLLAPMLTMRYLWLAVEDINPLNFLKKPNPKEINPDFKDWVKPPAMRYISREFTAFGIGGSVAAIMGFYTERTNNDIKTLYKEAVGYELDKKPQDVTMGDIYFKSQNAALKVTRSAFIRRTVSRFTAAASFFVPWHKIRDFKIAEPKWDANTNMGVGVVGAYITSEAFVRKPSFFDAEQNLVGTVIRHSINSPDFNGPKVIVPGQIQSLLILQKRHLNKHYTTPDFGSVEGQQQAEVSARIADLMNQTYHNVPSTEQAHFTIGKFNYLVGFGLMENYPQSLGYIELANKSSDMKDVKAVAASIKSGLSAEAAFKMHGIDLNDLTGRQQAVDTPAAPQKKFTDIVQSAKDRIPQMQRTLQDFAKETANPNLAP